MGANILNPAIFRMDSVRNDVLDKFIERSLLVMDRIGFEPTRMDDDHNDTGETAIIERLLRYAFSKPYETKYKPNKARQFLPINTEVPAGAQTYSYTMYDLIGAAKLISNYASDLPVSDVIVSETVSRIVGLGGSYGWSIQDLRGAELAGTPLNTHKAMAARRAVDNLMDEIAAFGDASTNLAGFLNHTNVTLVTPTTGTWLTASVQQILEDLRKMVRTIVVATSGQIEPDTVLFDQSSWDIVTNREMSNDNPKSILQQFIDTSPYIKNADVWHKLDTADAGGTGPRLVAYPRDPEVLELIIPQDFETFPPQAVNLFFKVLTHARIGGVDIRYPVGMAYMDGV